MRELRNAVQRAYVMAQDELIDVDWLPSTAGGAGMVSGWGSLEAVQPPATRTPVAEPVPSITLPIGSSMAEAERMLMLATLRHFNHHKERTAAALGISLKTLYNRLKEYAAEGTGVQRD